MITHPSADMKQVRDSLKVLMNEIEFEMRNNASLSQSYVSIKPATE